MKVENIYPIYFSSEKYNQLLVVQSEPEQKWIFKDKEISPEDLIKVLDSIPENTKELEEKYGFELILKEMWVWDDDRIFTKKAFVLIKVDNLYSCIMDNFDRYLYENASETDPRSQKEPEPKVGDVGYFWDDEESGEYFYGKLTDLLNVPDFKYSTYFTEWQNFSIKKQPWMK